MTKGWTRLLIQVANVFCLETIRKRVGNPETAKMRHILGPRRGISQQQALRLSLHQEWPREQGRMGPACSAPRASHFVVPQRCLWGLGFPSDNSSSCWPRITFPAPVTGSPQKTTPHIVLWLFPCFFFHLRNINFVSPTFRTKTGLQQKLNKGRMKKKNVFINIYFYQLFMIYKALATWCKMLCWRSSNKYWHLSNIL